MTDELGDLIENTCSPDEQARRVSLARQELARQRAENDPKLEANARALWAVRVLDVAEEHGWQFSWVTGAKRFALLVTSPDMTTLASATVGGAFEGDTKEAVRIAVAKALAAAHPELDPNK